MSEGNWSSAYPTGATIAAELRRWAASAADLVAEQTALASIDPPSWAHTPNAVVGGCFVCFERGLVGPGSADDLAWSAAAAAGHTAVVAGEANGGYEAGLLALREGPLLEAAVRALPCAPDVLLVDATGRDHPRGAGLALQLGAVLDLPTVGVTHRTLSAQGALPAEEQGAVSPLLLRHLVGGYWVRTVRGERPLAVHAAWRTGPDTAAQVVLSSLSGVRTPEPLRQARRAARSARAAAMGGQDIGPP